ncbi:MAG: hypothetical protein HYX94_13365 [Chloroflexi bacterium]|nr:hypothetical protein [Chloroflexota bacterium]
MDYQKAAFLFLGPPRVLMDGEDAAARIPAKHLALAAYVASSAPERVARNRVAMVFWSEKSDDASYYRLRHALWELRRAIGDGLLKSDHRSCWLCLDGGVKVDVLDFRTGCQALGAAAHDITGKDIERLRGLVLLYRGDLLEGLTVREAPLFEEWLLSERERLQLLYLDVLWYLSKAQVAAKPADEAVQTLNLLIEADPLRERSYRALMGVCLRRGDRTSALKVYARCAASLAAELGASPSPPTQRLRQMALQDAPEPATDEIRRATELLQKGKRQEAWDVCATLEAASGSPALVSQAALLRAEIALAEGRQGEPLRLVRTARQALGRLFGGVS